MGHTKCLPLLRRTAGFGLVEIMIAITLGLLLTAAVLRLFVANNQTYRTNESVARVQENSRYISDLLNKELRMTGYRGCMSRQSAPVSNTLNNASELAYDFGTGLQGYDNLSATLPTALATLLTGDPAPLSGTDAVLIRGPVGNGVVVTKNNNAAQLFANLVSTETGACSDGSTRLSGLCEGDILMVSDCSKARIFQLTGLSQASGELNLLHAKNNTFTPSNNIAAWDPNNKEEQFAPGAEIVGYRSQTYYLANNPQGLPTLYRKRDGNPAQPLLEGVFNLQLTYGEDTNGDRQVDVYRTAATVSDWGAVLTVRMDMLLGSSEKGLVSSPQQFAYNGGTFSASDTRWYLRNLTTAVIRNRLN